MEFYENKDKSIMCPSCRKFMTRADKRDNTVHKLKCNNCSKWIWFIPKTGECTTHEVPERQSSSGKRFY